MADESGSMGAAAFESIDSIAANVLAELDAPDGADDGTTATADSGAAEGTAPDQGEANGAEGGDQPEAEPDFLTASGVTLEQFLEDVPEEQRDAFETRYKQMQGHFSRKTAEVAEKARAAQAVLSENESLAQRIAELEGRIAQGTQPQGAPQRDAVQEYLTAGLGELITPEQAITSEEMLAKFVDQRATIVARQAQLPLVKATNERFSTVERQAYEQAHRESVAKVDALFAQAPQYRNEAVEGAIAELMQANPALPLEAAFNAVVAPMMMQDAGTVGRRVGMVEGRRSAEEVAAAKMRVSVPSSGVPGETGIEMPDNPTIEQAAEYAIRSMSGSG